MVYKPQFKPQITIQNPSRRYKNINIWFISHNLNPKSPYKIHRDVIKTQVTWSTGPS